MKPKKVIAIAKPMIASKGSRTKKEPKKVISKLIASKNNKQKHVC